MELENRRVLVVGLARSGSAAARFLRRRGAVVRATDRATAAELGPAVAELEGLGVELELGGHREDSFTGADLVVVSPGVPLSLPALAAARRRGVPVIGELELAFRFTAEPILAVTGTNGKTTVTELAGAMLAASGRKVFVGGNIGTPLIAYVEAADPAEVLVVEVSSFQLDTCETFRPRVGVLLNLTADHLDRYPDFAAYAASKMRLFRRQQAEDVAVLNADDPEIAARAGQIVARTLRFSRRLPAGRVEAAVGEKQIRLSLPGGLRAEVPLEGFAAFGAHNRENAAAAALAALACGASLEGVRRGLADFRPGAHRLEPIAEIEGVTFINDSKATNVDAVRRGIESLGAPIVLLMGGVDKGGDFGSLRELAAERVRAVLLLGEQENIRRALSGVVPVRVVGTMREAVEEAFARSPAGGAVLLAPGCASFDRYRDYRERGEDFRREVRRLAARRRGSPPEPGP
ncbi:MAG: UDP-N-acetylmuramoyl-L-alanine--D-glutamate ligase [Desulfobacterales bacterium]